jgi:hypothetical protein
MRRINLGENGYFLSIFALDFMAVNGKYYGHPASGNFGSASHLLSLAASCTPMPRSERLKRVRAGAQDREPAPAWFESS